MTDADAAFSYVREKVAAKASLDEEVILQVHRLCAAHLEEAEAGEYRWELRYVTTSRIYPPPPSRVPGLMAKLLSSPVL